jgi:hypothetical protein
MNTICGIHGKMRNEYTILVANREEKRHLRESRRKEDNII